MLYSIRLFLHLIREPLLPLGSSVLSYQDGVCTGGAYTAE